MPNLLALLEALMNRIAVVSGHRAGGAGGSVTPPAASVLTTITLTGPSSGVATHQAATPYSAVGFDQFGALFAVVPTFASASPTRATINSSSGVVTAVSAGTSSITASAVNSLGATITSNALLFTVTAQAVTTVVLSGPTSVIATHTTTAYTAIAQDQLGSTMTGQTFTYASGATNRATINSSTGVATGVSAGTSSIQATCATVLSNLITLTVAAQVPTIVSVSPTAFSIAVGATQALTTTVTDQGSPPNAISSPTVSYASGATGTATVNSGTGVVTGVAAGTTTITATSGPASGTSAATITAAGITSIASTPSSITAQAGSTQQLVIRTNAGTDVTSQCTFSSSAPAVAYADYKPTLTGATPNFIAQGTTGTVVLTGTNFTSAALGQAVVISPSTGITVNSTTFNSSTQITLNLTIAGGATAGGRTIQVTDAGHGNTATTPFSITGVTPTLPITSGLVLQLRADLGVSTSGSAVTAWTDQSPTGSIFSQPNTGQRPTYVTSAQNGLPIVRFDGADDMLQTAAVVSAINGTAVAVFTVGKRTAGAGDSLMFSNINVGNNTGWATGDTAALTLYYGTGSAVSTLSEPNVLGYQFDQVTWILNPNATNKLEIRRDGSSVAVSANTFVPQNTLAPSVGALTSPSGYVWNGDLAEVLIYDLTVNNLSLANIQTIEAYLKSKWGTP